MVYHVAAAAVATAASAQSTANRMSVYWYVAMSGMSEAFKAAPATNY